MNYLFIIGFCLLTKVLKRVCVRFVREVEVSLFLAYNLAADKQPD